MGPYDPWSWTHVLIWVLAALLALAVGTIVKLAFDTRRPAKGLSFSPSLNLLRVIAMAGPLLGILAGTFFMVDFFVELSTSTE